MTKEIIIGGVNVAECEFLRNCIIPDNYGCKIDDSLCCDIGNCYYKQLKRLEKDNYKQALEEIREILRDNIKLRTKGLEVEIHPEHIFLIEIYNKVNEVLK